MGIGGKKLFKVRKGCWRGRRSFLEQVGTLDIIRRFPEMFFLFHTNVCLSLRVFPATKGSILIAKGKGERLR